MKAIDYRRYKIQFLSYKWNLIGNKFIRYKNAYQAKNKMLTNDKILTKKWMLIKINDGQKYWVKII